MLVTTLGGTLLATGPRTAGAVTPAPGSYGYALVDVSGDVSTFGGAHYAGDRYDQPLNQPVVGATPTPDGAGYWLVAADGGVFSYGDAGFFGSMGGLHLNQPIVGMAASADGGGYWLVASDGGIFAFGDARFFGSMGGLHLNQPIVGMAASADGGGYWLVASDGGIFAFGDARFFGSMGGLHLNRPIVGMGASGDGEGYWLVASDGGVFSFGDARFFGSAGDLSLAAPVTAIVATPDGNGYLLVGEDGGVFTFGDAQYAGNATSDLHPPEYASLFSSTPPPTVTGMFLAQGTQASATGPTRVLLSGDSLSVQTAEGWATVEQSYGAWVQNGGIVACGVGVVGATELSSWTASAGPPWSACMSWEQQLERELALSHPNVVVVLSGYWESQQWLYDNQWVSLRTPSFQSEVSGQLAQLASLVHSYGASLVFLSAPYYANGTPNDVVDTYNSLIAKVPGAQVMDLHGLLDPDNQYAQTVDGIEARDTDGVHLSSVAPADLLAPAFLPSIVAVGNRNR